MAITALRTVQTARRVSAALALALALAAPAAAQEQSLPGGFSLDQIEGIESIIRSYLMNNPEVLIESLTAYQQRQKLAQAQRQQQAVVDQRAALTTDPDSPVLGNPDGDVVMVEFFDYRCPYCRRVAGPVREILKSDGNIRLVMKEWPILGPQSVRAARAALASVRQGKYEAFHFALMTEPGDMNDAHIRRVARAVGLDVKQLERDMESDEISEMLRRNRELASALDIRGTPAIVVGDTLVPGAVDLNALRRLVAKARAESS
ncbi:MAG: DsbA family protein [Kiloniellaceae bacterium]